MFAPTSSAGPVQALLKFDRPESVTYKITVTNGKRTAKFTANPLSINESKSGLQKAALLIETGGIFNAFVTDRAGKYRLYRLPLARTENRLRRRTRSSGSMLRSNGVPTSSVSSPTTPRPSALSARCCWSRTRSGSCSADTPCSKDSARSATTRTQRLSAVITAERRIRVESHLYTTPRDRFQT